MNAENAADKFSPFSHVCEPHPDPVGRGDVSRGAKPFPSSVMVSHTDSPTLLREMVTLVAAACLTILLIASWANRHSYRDIN